MQRILMLVIALAVSLSTVNCGESAIAQTATHAPGWTSGSRVKDLGNGTYYIGAEALFPQGFYGADLPFTLPSNLAVTHLEATVSWNAPCKGDVLMQIHVGGVAYPLILKTLSGAQSEMIHYDIPASTGDGTAYIHAEANPVCTGPYANMSSFEIQGLMQVQ